MKRSHNHFCPTCERRFGCTMPGCRGMRTKTCGPCLLTVTLEYCGIRSAPDANLVSSADDLPPIGSLKRSA